MIVTFESDSLQWTAVSAFRYMSDGIKVSRETLGDLLDDGFAEEFLILNGRFYGFNVTLETTEAGRVKATLTAI